MKSTANVKTNFLVLLLLLLLVVVMLRALAAAEEIELPDRPVITPGPPREETLSMWKLKKAEEVVSIEQPNLTGSFPYVPVVIPEPMQTADEISSVAVEPESAMTFLGRFNIVGYDTCVECCGNNGGITKSGTAATVGRTVAVNDLPFGTRLYIDGIGERVVEDRGYLADGVIDVLCNNHAECYAITGVYDVYLVEEAV